MAGKGRKEKIIDGDFKIIKQIEALGPQDKYTPKATQDKYDYLIGQLRKDMPEMKMGGKVQKMNMGGVVNTTKAMPVGMMDGGKVKPMKMNMGGVAKGRGGMFKGIR
mgnify:CR=1 FL=1